MHTALFMLIICGSIKILITLSDKRHSSPSHCIKSSVGYKKCACEGRHRVTVARSICIFRTNKSFGFVRLPHSLKSWGGGHQSHMAGSEVDLEAALPSFPCHGAYPKSEWKNHLSFEPYYHGLCSFSKRWKRNFELPLKSVQLPFFPISHFSLF